MNFKNIFFRNDKTLISIIGIVCLIYTIIRFFYGLTLTGGQSLEAIGYLFLSVYIFFVLILDRIFVQFIKPLKLSLIELILLIIFVVLFLYNSRRVNIDAKNIKCDYFFIIENNGNYKNTSFNKIFPFDKEIKVDSCYIIMRKINDDILSISVPKNWGSIGKSVFTIGNIKIKCYYNPNVFPNEIILNKILEYEIKEQNNKLIGFLNDIQNFNPELFHEYRKIKNNQIEYFYMNYSIKNKNNLIIQKFDSNKKIISYIENIIDSNYIHINKFFFWNPNHILKKTKSEGVFLPLSNNLKEFINVTEYYDSKTEKIDSCLYNQINFNKKKINGVEYKTIIIKGLLKEYYFDIKSNTKKINIFTIEEEFASGFGLYSSKKYNLIESEVISFEKTIKSKDFWK